MSVCKLFCFWYVFFFCFFINLLKRCWLATVSYQAVRKFILSVSVDITKSV